MSNKSFFLTIVTILNLLIFAFNITIISQPSSHKQKVEVIEITDKFTTKNNKVSPYNIVKLKLYHPTDYEINKNDSIIIQKTIHNECVKLIHTWSYDSINNNHELFKETISNKIGNELNVLNIPCESITYFFGDSNKKKH